MATQVNPAPTEPKKPTEPVKIEKTYKYFSPETFELVSEKVERTFVPPVDLADAMSRIGNDQGIVLKALTSYLSRAALREAKLSVTSKGIGKSIVLSVLRPFRAMAPFNALVSDKPTPEERAKQTDELLKMLRSNPAMIEVIKAASLSAAASDTDNDDDDEADE